ncbi:hypothetical protein V6N11_060379 [Hibiscus sabdariffa]|uniref:Gag-Pol polyprotein n=1 Tax=Hibiscus sabdariffa TaxID=183260 RepID=A0ABR2QQH0_9ROSI
MRVNPPRQAEPREPVQPREPAQAQHNPSEIQVVKRECLLSMKEMFDQLVSNLKQEHLVAQATAAPSKAPIDKLAQHRAYTFAGTIEKKPEEAEYWLECTTQIVTKQLACLDEQNLECVVALLVDEALKYIKMEKDKCRKFTNSLNDELGPMFTALEIEDFQILKAKHHHEGSSNYTPAPRSKFTPKPQSVNKQSFPVMSVNSTGNSEKTAHCQYCKKPHWGQCRFQSNLCYACGGNDYYIRDCPLNANKTSARPPMNSSATPANLNMSLKQAQSVVRQCRKLDRSPVKPTRLLSYAFLTGVRVPLSRCHRGRVPLAPRSRTQPLCIATVAVQTLLHGVEE